MAFTIEDGVLLKYTEEDGVTEIIVTDGITAIGAWAFFKCENLKRIVLPETVTHIERAAFAECHALESIHMPECVTLIGDSAFFNCNRLTAIRIPDGIAEIGRSLFYGCTALSDVNIPSGVTQIGREAFRKCRNLTSAVIPESVVSIGDSAFYECTGLCRITLPDHAMEIGTWAFQETPWLEEHPENPVIVGGNLIRYRDTAETLVIPEGVTNVEWDAFGYCPNLRNLTIPASVTSVGQWTFGGCVNLRRLTFRNITFHPKKLGEEDPFRALEMLETKDFSMKMGAEMKYAAIIGYFLQTGDADAGSYIKKSGMKLMKFLIGNGCADEVHGLLEKTEIVTKKNIDQCIAYAIEQGNPEIRMELLHYKSEKLGYKEPTEIFKL